MHSKLIIMLTLMFLAGCDKNEPKPLTELEKLPPATQEGKYTFGCLVNGKAFFTKSTLDVVAIYQAGILQISGGVNSPFQQIGIVLNENPIEINVGQYSLTQLPDYRVEYITEISEESNCVFEPAMTTSGRLTITKFDKVEYIISGLFEFSTKNPICSEGDIVVTDGRFDIKYIP